MKLILNYIRPYKMKMILGLGIKFFSTLIELFIPFILSYIIDDIVPLKEINPVLFWGIAMVILAFAALLTNIKANRMAVKVAALTTKSLRHDLFEKVQSLSCSQIDKFTVSSLTSRLTSDTYNIQGFVSGMQRIGVRAPILLVGGILITFFLDAFLCLIMILILPFIAIVVIYASKKGVKLYGFFQKKVDLLVRSIRENYLGIRVIKALSKTKYEKEKFEKINEGVSESEKKAGKVMSITNPISSMFLNLGMTAVVLVGAYLVNSGMSGAGKIIAFLSYFTLISTALIAVTRIFVMVARADASAKRIEEILEAKEDLKTIEAENFFQKEHIVFENISFSYSESEKQKYNLRNISFKMKKGNTLGIIGATGSGKSTIIQLLLRFYDPQKGRIFIDGKDIRSLSAKDLRNSIGVVFQNDFLIATSIYENIRFGREVSKEQVEEAMKLAQGEEFVSALDEGFDYKLDSKGANFSGGQKQRILIARALAAKPKILILDDSSSALDYKTDASLRKKIKENLDGTSSIIIAQRISSVKFADEILVLDKGVIVAKGKHDELIENCDLYKEIEKSQTGGD